MGNFEALEENWNIIPEAWPIYGMLVARISWGARYYISLLYALHV